MPLTDIIISSLIALVIIGIGGTLVKLFITRSFKANETILNDIKTRLIDTEHATTKSEKDIIRINENIKALNTCFPKIEKLKDESIKKDDFNRELDKLTKQMDEIVHKIDSIHFHQE